MIKLNNVSVNYGKNAVYQDFCFEFGEGVNVVLGPSGSGKTTLLNVIANLVDYTGECASDKAAVVFQTPCLSPVTVYNNVRMVVAEKNCQQQIDDVLKLTEIYEKRNSKAHELSGGEQQRVALARAFAANRPVLLLDEPFQSLDYGIKKKLEITLSTLLDNYCKTVLLVTHDVDEAIALADKVYLLSGKPCKLSQVAEITTARSLRDEYSTENIVLRKQLQMLLANQ